MQIDQTIVGTDIAYTFNHELIGDGDRQMTAQGYKSTTFGRTHYNTTGMAWFKMATKEFEKRGMSPPTYGDARDAYDMGETPETWAEYVLNS